MDPNSTPVLAAAAAWFAACAAAAGVLYTRRRGRPLGAADGLRFGGIGVLALMPCTLLLVLAFDGEPSLFAAAVQAGIAVLLFAAAHRARLAPADAASGMSFREKSALLVLAALTLVFGNYFVGAWNAPPGLALEAFIGAVIALIVLMIAGHLAIALLHLPLADVDVPRDERDRSVELRSLRNAHWVLAAGFFSVPVLLIAPLPLMAALNIWLALLVAAEIVFYGSTVAYYRRGIA